MAIDRDDKERVRQATDLVELLEAVTTVRRQGRTYMAVCPFHQEKTPSMSVDKARGLYHCFGCGAGGDVFQFVQETQGLQFNEAVEWLAARAGIVVRKDPGAAQRQSERMAMVDAVRAAIEFYQDRLKQGSDAGHARAYVRGRGYDLDVVDRFEIGYSPEDWDELAKFLRARGVKDSTMIGAGLAKRGRGGKLYDQFRGRLMFPIRDMRGDPVGFGARLLRGEGAKYLNSPETRLYQKAKLLYGLDRAKSDISRAGYAVVVEGYTDVIALHLAGYPRAVATCGTALGEDHFDLLRRFADRIVLAFDADNAGAGAAVRGDELQLPTELGLDLRVAVMPDGLDPAELVQQDRMEALQAAVEDATPMVRFRIERELGRFDLAEPEGRARAIRAVVPLIARLGDDFARREYARFVARATGTDLDPILEAVARDPSGRRPGASGRGGSRRTRDPESLPSEGPPAGMHPDSGAGASTVPPAPERPSGRARVEQDLLRSVLANDKDVRSRLTVDMFGHPAHAAAFAAIEPIATPLGSPLDIGGVEDAGIAALLRRLALSTAPIGDPDNLLTRLARYRVDAEIQQLRRSLADMDPESATYSETLQKLIGLERQKRQEPERST
jgi:DNA primase